VGPSITQRRAASGVHGESLAAAYLVALGMEILARNQRIGRFEIDIIGASGDLCIFAEVRTRKAGALVGALGSISMTKRANMLNAAERYWPIIRAQRSDLTRLRIDVVAVTLGIDPPTVEHFPGALSGEEIERPRPR
jgi:putative endonuclease